jgi:hypothetical protein
VKTYLVLVLALAACGKSEREKPHDVPVQGSASVSADKPADPTCAKGKQLEAFLSGLLVEEASHEINMGWAPVVIDRDASPVSQQVDNVTITPKTVSAYDVSEANHVDNRSATRRPCSRSRRPASSCRPLASSR